jgi:glycosyltransferase involved in cell wall biosynthesis
LKVGLFAPWLSNRVSGGDQYMYALAEVLLADHEVDLISLFPVRVHELACSLGFDIERTRVRSMHESRGPFFEYLDAVPSRHLYRDLYIARDAMRVSREYDVFVAQHFMSLAPARAHRNVLICQFPHERVGWRHFIVRPRFWPWMVLRYGWARPELASYQQVICYSEYSRAWIRKRWQVDATVVWPPIAVPPPSPAPKGQIILSVGRFFARGYDKSHGVQVEAFRKLHETGLLRGWELHMAGSRHYEDAADRAYYDDLIRRARGLPIHFHPDIAQAELAQLFDIAAIFWHSAGYGRDLSRKPEFAEHFGMSTVEAMGHGAVPVVIAAGGQSEIVRDAVDGCLWRTLDELVDKTRNLAVNDALRGRLSAAARERSRVYSPDRFASDIRCLMERLTGPAIDTRPAPPA